MHTHKQTHTHTHAFSFSPPPQADLQKDVERAKAIAEAEGRIKEGRENEDVNRRAAILRCAACGGCSVRCSVRPLSLVVSPGAPQGHHARRTPLNPTLSRA